MLKTHDSVVSANPRLSADVLAEFYHVYKVSRRIEVNDAVWPIATRVDIAYTYAFFGLSMESRHALAGYGDAKVKLVHDTIAQLRDRGGPKFSGWYKGKQDSLSYYMRNLFSMYSLIDQSALTKKDKLRLARVVRSKLSSYDQAVLALNIISHFGSAWEHKQLVERYKPFANVPQHFFGYDPKLSLKERFPMVRFEWEGPSTPRPVYKLCSIGGLHIVWYREWHDPLG